MRAGVYNGPGVLTRTSLPAEVLSPEFEEEIERTWCRLSQPPARRGGEEEGKVEANVVAPVEIEDEPFEHAEAMAWLDVHGEELAHYAGQWVALSSGRIVAHDPSLAAVMDAAREQGIERPFLIPVPPEGMLTP